MRILSFLLIILSFSFAQSQNSKNLLAEQTPCIFEMTIEQLTSDKLYFKCSEAFENKAFEIQNFKIKFKGHASIPIYNNALNFKSKEIVKSLNIGDYLTIFDIENLFVDNQKNQSYKTLMIKIVE